MAQETSMDGRRKIQRRFRDLVILSIRTFVHKIDCTARRRLYKAPQLLFDPSMTSSAVIVKFNVCSI